MADPIDYLAMMGGLGPSYADQQMKQALGQAQIGQANAQTQALSQQTAAAQFKQQRQQAYEHDIDAALKSGSPSAIPWLLAKYPEFKDGLKASYDAQDEATKRTNLTQAGELYSAINAGRPDIAIKSLERRITADKAAGQDTSDDEEQLDLLKSGDPKNINAVKGRLGLLMAAVVPDKFAAVAEQLGKGGEAFTLVPGAKRFGSDGELIAEAPFAPRAVTVGDGQTVIEYQPGGGDPASSGGAPSGGGGAPLSVRLNNPGAIRADPANKWQGQVGSQNGFVEFATPEDGARAHRKLIANQIKSGFDTPLKWAERYAPESDGNDPVAYAKRVADGLGIGVNDKIPLGAVPKVAAISAAVESGGSPAPSSSGVRVIAQGAPKPGFRMMTPAEVAATRGLDPSIPYQVSPQGQISPIAGTSGRTYRQIPNATSEKAQKNVAVLDALNRTLDGFRDNFGGNTITGGLENKMQAIFGTGTPGQREWWADFYNTDNIIRNQLFGSALTEHEKKAYEDTTISPRMSDNTIRKNLTRRRDIIQSALARQAKFLKANKYDPEAVDALFQTDALAGANLPRVRSIQEAMKLPKGTVFLTPDGRRKVR